MLAAFLLLFPTACQPAGTAGVTGKTLCVDPALPTCYDTIGGAIYNAMDGDTIQISANVYEEILYIKKSVNLAGTSEGPAPAIRTVIRSNNPNAPVIHIMLGKTVSLHTMEITGGYYSSVGGGGILNNGTLTATDVIVDHNTAFGYGAASSTPARSTWWTASSNTITQPVRTRSKTMPEEAEGSTTIWARSFSRGQM